MKWYNSSVGDDSISLTVKSLVVGIIPVVIYIAKTQGYDISTDDIMQIVNNVATIISLLGVTCGIIRKIYYRFLT